MAAVPVGYHIAAAGERCQEENEDAISGFLDYYIWRTQCSTIALALPALQSLIILVFTA